MDMKPVPTIFSDSQKCVPKSLLPTVTKQSKPPTIRVLQEDELEKIQNKDKIDQFDQLDESLLTDLEQGFSFMKEVHVLFYNLEFNDASVPEVSACVRINQDLRVKLFFKGLSLPLPQWFRQGRDTRLSSKSMLQNFVSYFKIKSESPGLLQTSSSKSSLWKGLHIHQTLYVIHSWWDTLICLPTDCS